MLSDKVRRCEDSYKDFFFQRKHYFCGEYLRLWSVMNSNFS